MRIIKGIEQIPVEHPVFLLFGQPGNGKSSLGYSCRDALLLDFDKGAHRAANRRDTLVIESWTDVQELMADAGTLEGYSALVVDTVGRAIDLMISHMANISPKLAPAGNPTLQGWGQIKTNFRTWIGALRNLGKDVLLIAHDKEDKDGDYRIVRPDIAGGSYGEVMKVADFIGYLYVSGKDRVLDFSPTDRWIGKNPAGWPPFKLPPIEKAGDFMARLFAQGRDALGALSDESAGILREVEVWRDKIAKFTTVQAFNDARPAVKDIKSPIIQTQVVKLLLDGAVKKGVVFSKATKKFIDAPTKPVDDPIPAA